jgi:chromosome segregation ATPase
MLEELLTLARSSNTAMVDFKADLARLNAQFDKLNAQFDKLNAQFDKLNVQFDKLNVQLSALTADVAAIKTEAAAVKADVATIKADMDAARAVKPIKETVKDDLREYMLAHFNLKLLDDKTEGKIYDFLVDAIWTVLPKIV